jgi:hypothetical protein
MKYSQKSYKLQSKTTVEVSVKLGYKGSLDLISYKSDVIYLKIIICFRS